MKTNRTLFFFFVNERTRSTTGPTGRLAANKIVIEDDSRLSPRISSSFYCYCYVCTCDVELMLVLLQGLVDSGNRVLCVYEFLSLSAIFFFYFDSVRGEARSFFGKPSGEVGA